MIELNLLTAYIFVFSSLIGINLILSTLVIFWERKNPTSTLLWVMAITFLPIIGFLLYLTVGADMFKSKMFAEKGIKDKEARVVYDRRESYELDEQFKNVRTNDYISLLNLFSQSADSTYRENNDVELFLDGRELFIRLLEDIENAKESIYIESYIIKNGKLNDELTDALVKKAREGLDVKILVDGMGGRKLNKKYEERLAAAGISFSVFYPAFLGRFQLRVNYRNHRKIYVIDSCIGYVGGFNIGDEYISLDEKFGYWRDTHLRITGDSVQDLLSRFFLDYRFASKDDSGVYKSEIVDHEDKSEIGVNIVSCGPEHPWEQIRDGYAKMVELAEDRIYLQTPYFIPDEGLFKSLRMAGFAGVDVRIMIPKKPDHPFVYWASLSYIGELLEAGVRVFTYKEDGFLHAKTLLTDDYVSSVGTANFDIRSFKLNFEVNAFIYDEGINAQLADAFYEDQMNSHEITLEEYNNRSRFTKIRESVSRLLSPLL